MESVKTSKEDLPTTEFKIVILGAQKVGKTAFVNQFKVSEDQKKYDDEAKANISTIEIKTNVAIFKLQVWDPIIEYEEETGDVKSTETLERILKGANGVILLFDVTYRLSYKLVPVFFKLGSSCVEGVEMTLVGNKADIKDRKVKRKMITFHRKKNIRYSDISALANYNIEEPLLNLIRQITKDSSIEIKEETPLNPAEMMMSAETIQNSLPEEETLLDDDL